MATFYDKATLLLLPAGYKTSKLYAAKPVSGLGDPVFSRGSQAVRRNSSGTLQTLAHNVPRIEYPAVSGCPYLLMEGIRTNLFINSATPATQSITVVNGTVYTVSVKGSGSVELSGAATGNVLEGAGLTFTASGTSLTCTVTGSLEYVQVEAGPFATSHVPTPGASSTRQRDIITISDLVANGILTADEGSIYFECGPAFLGTGTAARFFELGASANDSLQLSANTYAANVPTIRLRATVAGAAASNVFTTVPYPNARIMMRYTATDFHIFINGVMQGTSARTAFTPSLLTMGISGQNVVATWRAVALFNEALPDRQCIDWTK